MTVHLFTNIKFNRILLKVTTESVTYWKQFVLFYVAATVKDFKKFLICSCFLNVETIQ